MTNTTPRRPKPKTVNEMMGEEYSQSIQQALGLLEKDFDNQGTLTAIMQAHKILWQEVDDRKRLNG